jgi:light-regulated signal transduction histidine kinase (bacteriophytochrome)
MSVSAQLLQRRLSERLDQESHTWIDQIVTGAQRISRLLNGLLQFSRIGETAANESTRVNATSAAKEALADLQALIEETQADIFVDSLPSVMSEHALVCQIFQNLIANSLKYRTPTCVPKIRISAACKDGMCTFAVKDNGIGIAAEHHERIFLPFKRLHGAEIAGTGIGLATCKRIVERYGGRIWVESAEGEGCTFYFSLPVARESSHA